MQGQCQLAGEGFTVGRTVGGFGGQSFQQDAFQPPGEIVARGQNRVLLTRALVVDFLTATEDVAVEVVISATFLNGAGG